MPKCNKTKEKKQTKLTELLHELRNVKISVPYLQLVKMNYAAEVNTGPCPKSKMALLSTVSDDLKLLTIFTKGSILIIQQDLEFVFETESLNIKFYMTIGNLKVTVAADEIAVIKT